MPRELDIDLLNDLRSRGVGASTILNALRPILAKRKDELVGQLCSSAPELPLLLAIIGKLAAYREIEYELSGIERAGDV